MSGGVGSHVEDDGLLEENRVLRVRSGVHNKQGFDIASKTSQGLRDDNDGKNVAVTN